MINRIRRKGPVEQCSLGGWTVRMIRADDPLDQHLAVTSSSEQLAVSLHRAAHLQHLRGVHVSVPILKYTPRPELQNGPTIKWQPIDILLIIYFFL